METFAIRSTRNFEAPPSTRSGAAAYKAGLEVIKTVDKMTEKFAKQNNGTHDLNRSGDLVVLHEAPLEQEHTINTYNGTYNTNSGNLDGEFKQTVKGSKPRYVEEKYHSYTIPARAVWGSMSREKSEAEGSTTYTLTHTSNLEGSIDRDNARTTTVQRHEDGQMIIGSRLPLSRALELVPKYPTEVYQFSSDGPTTVEQAKSWEQLQEARAKVESSMEKMMSLDNTEEDLNPHPGIVVVSESTKFSRYDAYTEKDLNFDPSTGKINSFSSALVSNYGCEHKASFRRADDGTETYLVGDNRTSIQQIVLSKESVTMTEFASLSSADAIAEHQAAEKAKQARKLELQAERKAEHEAYHAKPWYAKLFSEAPSL